MRPSPINSLTRTLTIPRVTLIRRARSAREIGWCSRTRFRAILRLMSLEVDLVAMWKSCGLILRIGSVSLFVRGWAKVLHGGSDVNEYYSEQAVTQASSRW